MYTKPDSTETNPHYPISLMLDKKTGLIRLESPFPVEDVKPRYEWLTCFEPEDHLDVMVEKILELPGINKDSVFGGYSFKDDTTLARFKMKGFRNQWRIDPQGADVVIDTTGNSRVIEQAYELTHPDGKTIMVGVPNKGNDISINSLPLHFNKILTGSHGGDAIPDVEIPRYIRLMESGKMDLNGIITHEFDLEEINDAIDLFRSGKAGRIILKISC